MTKVDQNIESSGWRTIEITQMAELSLDNGNVIIKRDEGITSIPLSQLRHIIIGTNKCSISGELICEVLKNNCELILCDEKHNPYCELTKFADHNKTSGNVINQSNWSHESKDKIWQTIVTDKIRSEIGLLKELNIKVPPSLKKIADSVMPGDKTNREGQAARTYFHLIFGKSFTRKTDCKINGALNYGYTILLSAVNRIVAKHGYNTSLGINHRNIYNRFNLSCDIMEPFRYLVDKIVVNNLERDISDFWYKREFVEMLNEEITYKGKKMVVTDAIENYFLATIRFMNKNLRERSR